MSMLERRRVFKVCRQGTSARKSSRYARAAHRQRADMERMSIPAAGSSAGRLHVRPRDALRKTIEVAVDSWWPHRFVLREASDLWTSEIRDAWLAR